MAEEKDVQAGKSQADPNDVIRKVLMNMPTPGTKEIGGATVHRMGVGSFRVNTENSGSDLETTVNKLVGMVGGDIAKL